MESIKYISKQIENVIYSVEKYIMKHDESSAIWWAKANSIRHSHTINEILRYAQIKGWDSISMLNAGGMACGHQDFSISNYIRPKFKVSWTSIDHPSSPYLKSEIFMDYIQKYEIDLKLTELKDINQALNNNKFKIILFTEIVEHLEHGLLLQTLCALRQFMEDDGILIITTPNINHSLNRFKFLIGYDMAGYYGDGKLNLKAGMWGHISLYTIGHLKRLLSDCGWKTEFVKTFSQQKYHPTPYLFYLIDSIMPYCGQTIFIISSPGETVSIPFAL